MTTRTVRTSLIIGLALALAGAVSSCTPSGQTATGASQSASATPGTASGTGHAVRSMDDPSLGREVDGPHPRVAVSTKDGLVIIDALEAQPVATIPTDAAANRLAVSSDGRLVYLTTTDTGVTEVVDAGSWAMPHGDHYHYYLSEPRKLDVQLSGDTPIHQVSHAGRTAIFYDGTGTAEVVHDEAVAHGTNDAATITTDGPQHGVVVPLREGALVSLAPAAGGSPLPGGVARLDDAGKELERWENCPGLHGEAVVGDTAAFGCADGVLVVGPDGATHLEVPGEGEERVGQLVAAPGSRVMVGDLAADSLVLVDVDADSVREVAVGAPLSSIARDEEERAVVLLDTGELVVVDVITGQEVSRYPAIDAFELPEGHDAPSPQVAVAGHLAFVTDPAGKRVVRVDLTDGATTEIPLTSAPLRVGVTGL